MPRKTKLTPLSPKDRPILRTPDCIRESDQRLLIGSLVLALLLTLVFTHC